MKQVIEWSQGNPGALAFLLGLLKPENLIASITISDKINKVESLRGSNLYILFSDLCDKDYNKVEKLCTDCPDSVLADACSRQDRSGKALVAEFL